MTMDWSNYQFADMFYKAIGRLFILSDIQSFFYGVNTCFLLFHRLNKRWNNTIVIHRIVPFLFIMGRNFGARCKELAGLLSTVPTVKRSTCRKANCWDNAVAESFFKILKSGCTDRQKFNTWKEAEMAILEYIETWYNTEGTPR